MTAWAIAFGWNWLLVPVAIWFVNGVRKALLNPRIRLHSFTKHGGLYLADVTRQQLLPPWRQVRETWMVDIARPSATREGDGKYEDGYEHHFPCPSGIAQRLKGAVLVAKLREAETEELVK